MKKKSRGRPAKMELKGVWMKATTVRRLKKFAKYSDWPQGVVIDRALKLLEEQHETV